ncbi:MAG: hypothetical protein AVDCRST_MAG73-4015, partial [uncultured Thermomicrobiales bacterium]
GRAHQGVHDPGRRGPGAVRVRPDLGAGSHRRVRRPGPHRWPRYRASAKFSAPLGGARLLDPRADPRPVGRSPHVLGGRREQHRSAL